MLVRLLQGGNTSQRLGVTTSTKQCIYLRLNFHAVTQVNGELADVSEGVLVGSSMVETE